MAMTVHVWVKGDTSGDIMGDSTITSMGRENSIEAFKFESSVRTSREASSGMASGERIYGPVTITKRIDRSSPILHAALCNNEVVEVTIKFYRPNPSGDGTTEQFYTIELKGGRISSIKTLSPNCVDDSTSNLPAMEEVSLVFGEITWKYSSGDANTEHTDQWREST
jgi:type VI secretion system secreted protein Hcp